MKIKLKPVIFSAILDQRLTCRYCFAMRVSTHGSSYRPMACH